MTAETVITIFGFWGHIVLGVPFLCTLIDISMGKALPPPEAPDTLSWIGRHFALLCIVAYWVTP